MQSMLRKGQSHHQDGFVPVDATRLYTREMGQGQPLFILHGGPDFDHSYLRPEMDQLADSFYLIYYDQRGRGRSAQDVQPEDVSMHTELEDLDQLRQHFGLETCALLGHSWGAVLALEYALRYPKRVSRLVLLNPAPASQSDYRLLRQSRRERSPADIEKLKTLAASDTAYQHGDPDAVAAYYRIHFRAALPHPEHLEKVIERLRASFTKEGILKARAIEERLMQETWRSNGYDRLPWLRRCSVPTLVIHGEHDFIPLECARHIAESLPKGQFRLLQDCGHFSYLEQPGEVHKAISSFFGVHTDTTSP